MRYTIGTGTCAGQHRHTAISIRLTDHQVVRRQLPQLLRHLRLETQTHLDRLTYHDAPCTGQELMRIEVSRDLITSGGTPVHLQVAHPVQLVNTDRPVPAPLVAEHVSSQVGGLISKEYTSSS